MEEPRAAASCPPWARRCNPPSAFFLPSVKKKEGDLAASTSRAGVLQDQLNKSEAALSTALSQNSALTSELAEVNSLLAKVCICVSRPRHTQATPPLPGAGAANEPLLTHTHTHLSGTHTPRAGPNSRSRPWLAPPACWRQSGGGHTPSRLVLLATRFGQLLVLVPLFITHTELSSCLCTSCRASC